jgi:hypothetical protein
MDPDKINKHETYCYSQPVECLAGTGAQEVLKCGWIGKKSQLLGHVNKEHGLTMIHMTQRIEHTVTCVHISDYMQTTLVCAHGDLFWLTLKLDAKNNKRLEVVHYIGPAQQAKQFRYRCELVSVDGNTGVSFFSATRSIYGDVDNMFASKPYFQMDVEMFKRHFADTDGFTPEYMLSIEKI